MERLQNPFQVKKEIFSSYYQTKKLQFPNYESIPKYILDSFCYRLGYNIEAKPYLYIYLKNFMVITHKTNEKTYVGTRTTIHPNKETDPGNIYLIDISNRKIIQGYGIVEYEIFSPYVCSTRTIAKFQNKGLGTRRLFVMNALTQTLFEKPLHSDTKISAKEISIWEKLVNSNTATKYQYNNTNRFIFH